MNPYRFFLIVSKKTSNVIKFEMQPEKPDVSYLDNFLEVLEVTPETYIELQG